MKKNGKPFFATVLLLSVAGCNSTSYEQVTKPKALLESMTPSGLVVLPKVLPDGFFLESASANEGPGSNPLSGADSKKARRFQASIAKGASGGKDGRVLSWCSARPDDFAAMCSGTTGVTFFDGRIAGMRVVVYGDDVGATPRSADDLTTKISESPWSK